MTKQSTGYCSHCKKQVLITSDSANHILHLLLTIITSGFWGIIWLAAALSSDWRCSQCGKSVEKGSKEPEKIENGFEKFESKAMKWSLIFLAIIILAVAGKISEKTDNNYSQPKINIPDKQILSNQEQQDQIGNLIGEIDKSGKPIKKSTKDLTPELQQQFNKINDLETLEYAANKWCNFKGCKCYVLSGYTIASNNKKSEDYMNLIIKALQVRVDTIGWDVDLFVKEKDKNKFNKLLNECLPIEHTRIW